ncbi:MAG: chorismate synthase, partial [Thermodesulfovibrionales bacterium]
HGKALTGIIEGMPAGLSMSSDDIDRDLRRRQAGHGRGGRMKIESDHAEILSGVRWGMTLGSPITLVIENRDWQNWTEGMSVDAEHEGSIEPVTRARPGHADLCGALKYDQGDIRNILERSSARETAMRVALGAVARKLLEEFGIRIGSYVTQIGARKVRSKRQKMTEKQLFEMFEKAESSSVRCPDEKGTAEMVEIIDEAKREGNSLGGIFEVFAAGLPVGLGSHVQWYRKIDGRLAQAIMSIQAIKGVETGLGFEIGGKPGSEVMDEIFYGRKKGFYRKTNNAGGIEGGMTNGMPLIIRAVMKPVPTQKKPLRSVDIVTKETIEAAYERSDVCAVPAAGVIAEAMVALVLADAFLEKFGGDSIGEIKRNYESCQKHIRGF